jgi:CRP-like cAMP-binding protein
MNNALLEICRNMSYESFQAREVILRQGEVSNDKLYVILTGSVSVFLDTHLNTPPSDY